MGLRSVFPVLAVLLTAGCASFSVRADQCPAYPAGVAQLQPVSGTVKVQYLGAGGYMVQRGGDVVLFGPQFTNPSVPEIAFDHEIRTDRALVDRLLPADANDAAAIVIGHGHYDHLLDTPYIANAHAKNAKVYGSATMKNLISSAVDPARLVDVGISAASNASVKINDRVRLWPLRSRHSDQMRIRIPLTGINVAVHMWRGEIPAPLSEMPKHPSGWAEGEVYAYVLDFIDAAGTAVEFRVYYQDAGTDGPLGYPFGENAPTDKRRIDAALISVGGDFPHSMNHPEGVIKATKPRFLVLGHWENFFEQQTDVCRTGIVDEIPLGDTPRFIRESTKAMKDEHLPGKPILPCPTASVFHFPVSDSNDAAVYSALKKNRATYDCPNFVARGPR